MLQFQFTCDSRSTEVGSTPAPPPRKSGAWRCSPWRGKRADKCASTALNARRRASVRRPWWTEVRLFMNAFSPFPTSVFILIPAASATAHRTPRTASWSRRCLNPAPNVWTGDSSRSRTRGPWQLAEIDFADVCEDIVGVGPASLYIGPGSDPRQHENGLHCLLSRPAAKPRFCPVLHANHLFSDTRKQSNWRYFDRYP